EEDTNRILGAHLVGPRADEVINLFALCIRHDLTSKDLADTVFADATVGSDVGAMV
ncbi:MAG: NAD(P)/FAD-dependent oxidoreductase, partial [Acetobacteraceae bacterium]